MIPWLPILLKCHGQEKSFKSFIPSSFNENKLIWSNQMSLVISKKVFESQSVELSSISDFACLPNDVLGHVFHFLNAEELTRIAPVCRVWNTSVSLDTVSYGLPFPSWLKDIDADIWRKLDLEKYGLDISEVPRVNRRALTKALKPLSRKVKNQMGITNMVIPKGLTLNIVLQIAKDYSVPIGYICGKLATNFGDIAVKQTRVLFFTNSIFKGTLSRLPKQHESCVTKIGQACEIAIQGHELRNFMAFLVLTYISSSETPPIQLYSSNTLTRLIGKANDWSLIGGFASDGLTADDSPFGSDDVGVGAFGNSDDFL
jgi:hypothetical protein